MRKTLGIDPGTNFLGYAVLNEKKQVEISGIIDLSKIKDPYEKLKLTFNRLNEIIKNYQPTDLAIEAPFYGKNAQSMLKLGRSQGVAITVAIINGLSITEYSPRKVKQAITGNGNASKEQVFAMLKKLLEIPEIEKFDQTDAIAVALCHLNQKTFTTKSKYKSWSDFVNKNENKIID